MERWGALDESLDRQLARLREARKDVPYAPHRPYKAPTRPSTPRLGLVLVKGHKDYYWGWEVR